MKKLDVHGRFEKLVVTLLVMRAFSNFPGALRACAYFRDPTAVSRRCVPADPEWRQGDWLEHNQVAAVSLPLIYSAANTSEFTVALTQANADRQNTNRPVYPPRSEPCSKGRRVPDDVAMNGNQD